MVVDQKPQANPQAVQMMCAMALLHRMAKAAGGRLVIRLDEIPEQLPFTFDVHNGVGVLTALDKPRSAIVPATSLPR